MIRFWFLSAILALGLGAAKAQNISLSLDELHAAAQKIDQIDAIDHVFAGCPTEIYKSEVSFWRRWSPTDEGPDEFACAANFSTCLSQCLDDQNAQACTGVSWTFEQVESAEMLLASRKTYAWACALGNASACTNRAAGLRNAAMEGDGFSIDQPAGNAQCLLNTFDMTCAQRNAWGCVMQGVMLQEGDAGPPDLPAALAKYRLACQLSDENGGDIDAAAPCRMIGPTMQALAAHLGQ